MQTETAPTTELVVLLQDSGLDASKTRILSSRFADYFTIAEHWKNAAQQLTVTDESQTGLMKDARYGRLILREKRIAIERTRKELKDDSLKEGRAIDAVAKLLTSLIEPTEKFLEDQEKFAERLEEARERVRIEVANSWKAALAAYDYVVTTAEALQWNEVTFNSILVDVRDDYQRQQQRREQEAEAQRKADQRNRDELLLENQRLQNEQRQQQLDNEAKWQQHEQEQQQLRDEAQALRNAELKRKREADEQQRQAQLQTATLAAGPDKIKMVALADQIKGLTLTNVPSMASEKAIAVVGSAYQTLDKIQNWLREQADTL